MSAAEEIEPEEATQLLLRDLRSASGGLSTREAARRLVQYGPNELRRHGGVRWPGELARQLTHPLALLLWLAAGLSFAVGSETVAIAVLLVIALNAAFAFIQEMQAERAVEALARYMPQHATVLRDGAPQVIDAGELVPGDIALLEEGERIAADMRLLSGALEVDLSTLTGESVPAVRSAEMQDAHVPRLAARDLVFSGTSATGGEARAVVFATGMHTELGRIAALSERVKEQPSPLERQVRRVAWLIAAIAVAMAVAFVPLAIFAAGLSIKSSVVFAVGLLAGNVPEGLLPVITLALAVAVSALARRGALVKRLSAVETLGSTDVICTDKTGTLTQNRMRPVAAWTLAGEAHIPSENPHVSAVQARISSAGSRAAAPPDGQPGAEAQASAGSRAAAPPDGQPGAEAQRDRQPGAEAQRDEQPAVGARRAALGALAETAAACNQARLQAGGEGAGDPTELALLRTAQALGADVDVAARERCRRHQYNFDPRLKLMSTLDVAAGVTRLHTKGAPEAVLQLCTSALGDGAEGPLDAPTRARILAQVEGYAHQGLRVLALARRTLPAAPMGDAACAGGATPVGAPMGDAAREGDAIPVGAAAPAREQVERELCFVGLVTMLDPPRAEVPEAVARCHSAGIRIIVITGDHPLTAAAIARQVGIGGPQARVIDAERLDHRQERQVEQLLAGGEELIFARSSPEAKLQIAEALRAQGHVVAMTGDGVNDAPALRSADIGVAMGRSGTDVAREAATMVLTDDNFATIVTAVEAGRRVYDNVRKFIVYIFAHATPEVAPFLVFALAGGAIPLPLPVLLLLAFDVGTETLPSLALGRDPAEPGIMQRPPRVRSEGVIRGPMLVRAWLFLGVLVAALSLGCFFAVLVGAGWHPGEATGVGTRFHHAYLQATTMTFLGMIAGQIGTAFAVRTQRASLRSVGAFSNRYLLLAVLVELLVAAVVVYAPPLQSLLATAGPPPHDLLLLLACPLVVWGADELRRAFVRRRAGAGNSPARPAPVSA